MTAVPTQGYSLAIDFQAILNKKRANTPKAPTKTFNREPARNISAAEFITRNNRANYDEQKDLIRAYMGHYSISQPHGTQLDAARRAALLELRPIPAELNENLTTHAPNVSGMIAQLLSNGRDLQRRVELATEFDYSEEVIITMKRQLREVHNNLQALTS